ncbi:MAG: hypothetical protein AAFV45_08835 [Pseudomonadota bacterium]
MLSHMVLFREGTTPRHTHQPAESNPAPIHQMSNGTHAMPLQPPVIQKTGNPAKSNGVRS